MHIIPQLLQRLFPGNGQNHQLGDPIALFCPVFLTQSPPRNQSIMKALEDFADAQFAPVVKARALYGDAADQLIDTVQSHSLTAGACNAAAQELVDNSAPDSTSPDDALQTRNTLRRQQEYSAIVAMQATMGVRITSPVNDYNNQSSRLHRECDRCTTCQYPLVIAAKAKAGQVCPLLGKVKAAAGRVLPWSHLAERIQRHPSGVDLVGGEESYVNSKSKVTVQCRQAGHLIRRAASDFSDGGRFQICSACAGYHLGETTAIAITRYLLKVDAPCSEIREQTPVFLRAAATRGLGRLRFDGFFTPAQTTLNYAIAIEHQGTQHEEENSHFHGLQATRNSDEAHALLLERDAYKRLVCPEHNVRLIEIQDLVAHTSTLIAAAEVVATRLETEVPEVLQLPGYAGRRGDLAEHNNVLALIAAAGADLSAVIRLQQQLVEEGSSVEIVDFDPVSGFFTLRCSRHPAEDPRPAHARNALGSRQFGRQGTRCRYCQAEKIGDAKRLSFPAVAARADALGATPLFDAEKYISSAQYLPWRWQACGHHFEDSLSHLQEGRACSVCGNTKRSTTRRQGEYDAIAGLVAENGDQLLSPATAYINQHSLLHVLCSRSDGCGAAFEMKAVKIKIGRLHHCDSISRARAKRRQATQSTTTDESNRLGKEE